MARRKKRGAGGVPKYAIVALAVVFIGGFLIIGLPFIDNTIDLTEIISPTPIGELSSSVEFFSLPASPFVPLALQSFGVECSARFTLVAINEQGQTIATINSKVNTSPLFIDLDLVKRGASSTPANTIKDYQVTPKIKCGYSGGGGTTGANIGYFLPHPQTISFTVSVKAPNGSGVRIGTFSTTAFSHGDLGNNVERFMPTVTIPASQIDVKAPTFTSKYDSEVNIAMGGQLTFSATTGSGSSTTFGEYLYFIGQNQVVTATHLITVDKVDAPATEGEQTINILSVHRQSDRADLLSLQTAINSLTQDNREATLDVFATLRGFQDVNFNEALPKTRILECLDTSCNSNRLISNTVTMFRLSSTSDSFRGFVSVPLGAPAGHYAVEVFSADRTQVSSRGFLVEQVSVTCPDPSETLIGGVCTPIAEPQCNVGYAGTPPDCFLIDTTCPSGFSGTQPNCVPDATCADSNQIGTYPNCSDPETPVEPMCNEGFSGTPPDCVADNGGTNGGTTTSGGAKGKIEYVAKYVASGDTATQGCTDAGSIPTSGIDIQAFQLIAGTGMCGGNQFGSVDIRPIIDFGSQTVNVDAGSVGVDAQIWVSVNDPFPASPEWGTGDDPTAEGSTCRITSKELPTSCIISNHDFSTSSTKKSSFTSSQIVPVTQLRSGTSIYDVALLTLSSAEIEKKVTDAGLSLKDGDEYSFLVQFVTKFSATVGNSQIDGVVPATALHYTFNYAEGADISCDLTKSFEKVTCTELSNGEMQCTTQCVDRGDECPREGEIFNAITMTCDPPPPTPNTICPDGLVPPAFTPFTADQCEQPPAPISCEAVPTCSGTEKLAVTGTTDSCGFEILQCVPKIGTQGDGCPENEIKNTEGVCVPTEADVIPPLPTGGCPAEYALNAFGNCQRIGSGTEGNGGGGGGTDDVNFCALDKFFENPSRCFSQIFSGDGGTGGFTLTGATGTAVWVAGLVIVLLIVIAVIVRIRRGGGFKV